MILTVEQTKEFFRANKEVIKGSTVVFRWNGNQNNGKTLNEIGNLILKFQSKGSHFNFFLFGNDRDVVEIQNEKQLIDLLTTGNVKGFYMIPETPATHAERMSAGHYGKLD